MLSSGINLKKFIKRKEEIKKGGERQTPGAKVSGTSNFYSDFSFSYTLPIIICLCESKLKQQIKT